MKKKYLEIMNKTRCCTLCRLQTEHSGIGFNPFVNASHTDAERHYFGKDHLGSVRAVTNQWGSPLRIYDYDVFGTPLQDRPERFRHGFTGKEFDSWTGLYNYGFRDYASLYGRFTTVDPIQDGHNWYAYVNSDPVSWLDPWGLKPCEQQSGEDKKKKKSIVAPVINFGKNIQKWAENTKGNIDEWAHNQKRKIKEDINKNTNAFLKKNLSDVFVIIPENSHSYTDPNDLVLTQKGKYMNVNMDGIYNVTTGELVKVPNGFSLIAGAEDSDELPPDEPREYTFENSVEDNFFEKFIAEKFGDRKVIPKDELANNPNEASWLEQDLVKQAIELAKERIKK